MRVRLKERPFRPGWISRFASPIAVLALGCRLPRRAELLDGGRRPSRHSMGLPGGPPTCDHAPMDELTLLGHASAIPTEPSPAILEAFGNPSPNRDYVVAFTCPEFTCVCPITGQPDFAEIRIAYVPDSRCVELKSLKLYLMSFRNTGTFHEAVTNRMVDDLAALLAPRALEVISAFAVRGGITTVVTAVHGDRGLLARLR